MDLTSTDRLQIHYRYPILHIYIFLIYICIKPIQYVYHIILYLTYIFIHIIWISLLYKANPIFLPCARPHLGASSCRPSWTGRHGRGLLREPNGRATWRFWHGVCSHNMGSSGGKMVISSGRMGIGSEKNWDFTAISWNLRRELSTF